MDRFWSKVDRSGGPDACWPWTAAIYPNGYGLFRMGGAGSQQVGAHRASYILNVRPLEPGEVVHHRCGNKACVNPAHLAACASQGDHRHLHRDASCRRGHPLTGPNLYVSPRGQRRCRSCDRERARRRKVR